MLTVTIPLQELVTQEYSLLLFLPRPSVAVRGALFREDFRRPIYLLGCIGGKAGKAGSSCLLGLH